MRRAAIFAIDGYRRYVSPYKGFSCAHARLHGAGSCSAYGRAVFEHNATWLAFVLLRQRFAECKAAAFALRSGAIAGVMASSVAVMAHAGSHASDAAAGEGEGAAADESGGDTNKKAKTSTWDQCAAQGCALPFDVGSSSCSIGEACSLGDACACL